MQPGPCLYLRDGASPQRESVPASTASCQLFAVCVERKRLAYKTDRGNRIRSSPVQRFLPKVLAPSKANSQNTAAAVAAEKEGTFCSAEQILKVPKYVWNGG